jgi:hypothetical protein
MRSRPIGVLVLIAALAAGVPGAGPAAAQQPAQSPQTPPAPPFHLLLPLTYPYPLLRTCSTNVGICAIPHGIAPGTPCYCQAPNGVWVTGVCTR